MNLGGAQLTPTAWHMFTIGGLLRPSIEFSPCAHEESKAAAVGNEELSLPGELVRAQHAVVLLPDPCLTAYGHQFSVHVQMRTYQVPPNNAAT